MGLPAHRGASSRQEPEGGGGGGVPRPRLVAVVSGGWVPRPPGTTTWLRGARCTDPEAMPEKEARDPAENRHGGAPRGAPPSSKGGRHPAGCLARSVIAGLPGAAAPGAFVGAPSGWRTKRSGEGETGKKEKEGRRERSS